MEVITAIRVRGRTGIRSEIEKTLILLRLTRVNHCVLLSEGESIEGMLKKCQGWITWGKISEQMLEGLLIKRGRIGKKPIPKELIPEIISEIKEKGKIPSSIKPVFRLHPPRKGWKSTKELYPHGALGDRGEGMNELIKRMM